jgi:ribonuclease BN (tRNA processing enzyme)
MEVMFPGSSTVTRRFDIQYAELAERTPRAIGPATVTAFAVEHASGATPNALRVEYRGKIVSYSGDTEWTPALIDAARDADVFVCEAYSFEKKIKFHLDLASLREHAAEIQCRRVILTHMGPEMLAHIDAAEWECADDRKTITL